MAICTLAFPLEAEEVKADGSALSCTGLLLSDCRHGCGLGAINMHEGESMTYTFFLKRLLFEKNCAYFCSDIICRYQKFAKKLVLLFLNVAK